MFDFSNSFVIQTDRLSVGGLTERKEQFSAQSGFTAHKQQQNSGLLLKLILT